MSANKENKETKTEEEALREFELEQLKYQKQLEESVKRTKVLTDKMKGVTDQIRILNEKLLKKN